MRVFRLIAFAGFAAMALSWSSVHAGDSSTISPPAVSWQKPWARLADQATNATNADNATNAVNATKATLADQATIAQSLGAGATVDASKITGSACPAGQALTITAAGTLGCAAVSSANLGVGSCDSALTLVGGKTAAACCAAGGNVVSGGGGSFLCKFTGASCHSGWGQYQYWSTTFPGTVSTQDNDGGTMTCVTGSHAFSNAPVESILCGNIWVASASATVVEIGCY